MNAKVFDYKDGNLSNYSSFDGKILMRVVKPFHCTFESKSPRYVEFFYQYKAFYNGNEIYCYLSKFCLIFLTERFKFHKLSLLLETTCIR